MALKRHLESRPDKPIVRSSVTPPKAGTGTVTSNVKNGELFLRSTEGKVYRLSWTGAERSRERRVPLGTYHLVGYRLVKGGWHLSASGGRSEIVVGETPTRVTIPTVVAIDFRARPRGRQVALQMGISNGARMGVSIFKNGVRVPMRFRLAGRGGGEVASGSMNYG